MLTFNTGKNRMKLFTPTQIGAVEVKNRIVMPAMHTGFVDNGQATEKMIRYYAERAKGGAGLIIVEACCVEQRGKTLPLQLMISNDKFIPALERLSRTIKKYGAKSAIQLQHAGIRASARITQMQAVSPSGVSDYPPVAGPPARVLEIAEIHELILIFVEAARRAKEAGFDAIELQCAHSFLIDQFMSPRFNRRQDIYGGNTQNRARFACEIVQSIKEKVGTDYPVICRITGDDYVVGGITLKDAKINAALLVQSGADCIHISVGVSENMRTAPPMSIPRGCFVHLAQGVKEAVNVPVIAVGRIKDPIFAEQILADQKADLIAMGRALIADPAFPEKARKGKVEDIVPCISCNQGCIARIASGLELTCLVNPAVGRERDFQIEPADIPKKVLIAGAGPAGMETARMLSLRGHRPILYEKEDKLGGQLDLAWRPPYKGEIVNLLQYYKEQLRKLKVELHLKSEVTRELVRTIKPDVLVVCTGAYPKKEEIPGVGHDTVVQANDVIGGSKEVHGKAIILGSRQVALETAEFLYEKGNQVTIVARANALGLDMDPRLRDYILKRLSSKSIEIITHATVKEIKERGLCVDIDGTKRFIDADTIVLAWGSVSDHSLTAAVEGMGPELQIYIVGDCVEPRNALYAIHEASYVGRII